MSDLLTRPAAGPATAAAMPPPPARKLTVAGAFAGAGGLLVVLAAIHITQGTAAVGPLDLLHPDQEAVRVLVASRLPRLLAALTVGGALGIAGAALQSIARNPLASPDTLAVNSGAFLAVVAAAAFGLTLPALPAGAIAFLGGLAAAGLVLLLSAGGRSGPTRVILAGTVLALALHSATFLLLLLYEQATVGLYAWGSGTLVQTSLTAVSQLAPVVLLAAAGCLLLAHRLDILGLGDDTAAALGVHVRQTRLLAIVLAVLLAAAAVTLAGPIGFVGLSAPVIVRLLAARIPGLHRHLVLLPLSGIAGVLVVLVADIAVRAVLGGQAGVEIPTGVVTTVAGAAVLVWLARRHRDSGPTRQPPAARLAAMRSRRFFAVVLGLAGAALAGAIVLGLLLGDTWLLTGDVVNWLQDRSGTRVTFVLDQRVPRVLAAVLAGSALAVAGTAVQAACRNPLAEPGLLGITAGAGVGAVALLTLVPLAGLWAMAGAAGVGAVIAFAAVYALAWRGGLNPDRLVLIGIGFWSGGMAIVAFIIVAVDPWNTAKALTWLSGSTYGRTMDQLAPVALALLLGVPLVALARRELDLLTLDEDTPRILGIRIERARLVVLGTAAALTATAVAAVGVIGFVGLVAPHAARALVGGAHARVIPVAAVLGALLVSLADTLGRTVIAPAQIPAGLVTALVGAPYFLWLLWRTRG